MERSRKRELRQLNSRVWAGENDVFPVQKSLDSSMKKNTAFIKRLRTSYSSAGQNAFLQEIKTLSLHKYLSEIISACYEGLCKAKTTPEIACAVEVVSALHQRFGPTDFTRYIGWLMGRGLSTPDKSQLKGLAPEVKDKEEKDRLARHKVLLRVATELWLVGVLRSLDDVAPPEEAGARAKESGKVSDKPIKSRSSKSDADSEPFPLEVLKDMLSYDREHINLPIVALFVKNFSWDILGVKLASTDGKKSSTDDDAMHLSSKDGEGSSNLEDDTSKDPPIISQELRQRFKNIFARYFEDVKAHLVRDQKTLAHQSKRNAEAYVKSGHVFEDRQDNYEKQVKAQERLVANAQILAAAVGTDMPDLKEDEGTGTSGEGSIGLVKAGEYLRGQGEGPGIWEDEEERRFYENLIDLKDRVPGILLEDAKKKKSDHDEQVGKRVDAPEGESKEVADAPATEGKSSESDDQSTAIANKSVGAQVDALLGKLPELTTKETVDQLAMDFCFLNSKASRNRLIKALQDIPKGRFDLLPLYSRLVATLGKHMPDVGQGLVAYLDSEFRGLQRRKQKDYLGQVRLQNIRYLAELTKFGVVPEHVIFHCLRVCLEDFSRVNIEIMCNLLENCGRYLARNPETSPRMTSFLETLQRKKAAQHLVQQDRMLIENAVYYINPPERVAIEQKERTPIELFLRKIIYLDLAKRTLDKTERQIRKLHWEEPEVVSLLEKIMSKPGKIKYGNVHFLACLLSSLNRHHMDFVVSVVDNLLESITLGLEINDFRFNQKRVAEVKYLGELYVYRIVDSTLIFDTLYKFVRYGHVDGLPRRDMLNSLDLPNEFFRIRLVCVLLETCGTYYHKGTSKKKLDMFLTFFQYYYYTKEFIPMDVAFLVQDAFALVRPQWKFADNYEEAHTQFGESIRQNIQSDKPVEATGAEDAEPERAEAEDVDDDSMSDERDGEDTGPRHLENDRSDDEDDDASADDEDARETPSESEDEQIVVTRQEEERDPEEEADFDREFQKMMAESLDSRKNERQPRFDVPLPMLKRSQAPSAPVQDDGMEQQAPSTTLPNNMMKFSLLSKRGNKQQTKEVEFPSDSTFAVALRTQQQAEKAEQQRIKKLVLDYDLRDENDGDGGIYGLSSLPLFTNPNRPRNSSRLRSRQSPPRFSSGRSTPSLPSFRPKQPINLSKIPDTSTEHHQGIDRQHNPYAQTRVDKASSARAAQRGRKLQLSDVDWYAPHTSIMHSTSSSSPCPIPAQALTRSARRAAALSTPVDSERSSSKSRRLDAVITRNGPEGQEMP